MGKSNVLSPKTKFFRNPRELAGMHRKMRKALNEKGYDIQQENKPIEQHLAGYMDKDGVWHQQGLTPDQLKEHSQRKEQLQKEEEKLRIEQYKINERSSGKGSGNTRTAC